jgi:hypothetical protein
VGWPGNSPDHPTGVRNDLPTRTADNSPECTRRYTVIFDTRINDATSATVRNLTSDSALSGRVPAIGHRSFRHVSGAGFPSGTTDTHVLNEQ